MRKSLVAGAALLVLAAGIAGALDIGEKVAVSVREGELRSAPGFLSVITANLEYGDMVEVLEVNRDWARVRVVATGDTGWLHAAAVAEARELRLEATGDTGTSATSREIALAGRGFNEQVEAQYQSDSGLDFALVDEMEAWEVPVEGLVTFLGDGGLAVDGGGSQ